MGSQSSLTKTDRWFFKPAIMALIAVTALEFFCQIPGLLSLLLITLLLLGYGIALIVVVAITGYCIIKKRPRRGASVLFMLLLPMLLWRPLNWAADLAHLGITSCLGAGQLGTPSKSNDGNFIAYDWSVGLAIGPSTFLIYDKTDEIALPLAQQKHPPDSEMGFADICAGRVQRLIGHYYVCSF